MLKQMMLPFRSSSIEIPLLIKNEPFLKSHTKNCLCLLGREFIWIGRMGSKYYKSSFCFSTIKNDTCLI